MANVLDDDKVVDLTSSDTEESDELTKFLQGYKSSDDELELPAISDLFPTPKDFREGQIIWSRYKHFYWPAIIRKVYKKDKKVSLWYLDSVGKTFVVPFKNVHRFNDIEFNTVIRKDIKATPMGHFHEKVFAAAMDYIYRLSDGYRDDPLEFFPKNIQLHKLWTPRVTEEELRNEGQDRNSGEDPLDSGEEIECDEEEDEKMKEQRLERAAEFAIQDEEYLPEPMAISIVECIASGQVNDYLMDIACHKIKSLRQEMFDKRLSNKKVLLYNKFPFIIRDPAHDKAIYDYLDMYFRSVMHKKKWEWPVLTYITNVWMPEAMAKAKDLVENGMKSSKVNRKLFLDDAETMSEALIDSKMMAQEHAETTSEALVDRKMMAQVHDENLQLDGVDLQKSKKLAYKSPRKMAKAKDLVENSVKCTKMNRKLCKDDAETMSETLVDSKMMAQDHAENMELDGVDIQKSKKLTYKSPRRMAKAKDLVENRVKCTKVNRKLFQHGAETTSEALVDSKMMAQDHAENMQLDGVDIQKSKKETVPVSLINQSTEKLCVHNYDTGVRISQRSKPILNYREFNKKGKCSPQKNVAKDCMSGSNKPVDNGSPLKGKTFIKKISPQKNKFYSKETFPKKNPKSQNKLTPTSPIFEMSLYSDEEDTRMNISQPHENQEKTKPSPILPVSMTDQVSIMDAQRALSRTSRPKKIEEQGLTVADGPDLTAQVPIMDEKRDFTRRSSPRKRTPKK